MKRILSIDGGGIRGIIPAMVLAKLERLAKRPTHQLFDLIAGTSTGGILGLALVKPDARGKRHYSAEEAVALYEEFGHIIFGRPVWKRLLRSPALLDEKYAIHGIEEVLGRYFGDTRLKEALTPVFITSYEIERRVPFFFRSLAACREPEYDFPMKLVARATSAAPTYFEPLKIPARGPAGYYALVDGGLYANNPSMCALIESRGTGHQPSMFVSLGTGALTRPIPYADACGWGLARWAKPVLDIAFDGVSSTVDYQLRRLLAGRYVRFQPALDPGLVEMDNATPQNIRRLKLLAEAMLREREAELERLLQCL